MASKGSKHPKKREVAKLVTENREPCVFCNQDVDDEVIYGKLYALGDIQCHYFCVLLSCCLVQKGRDSEGLFGFLYKDIMAEVERSKKHKCSYCGRGGASLGCSVAACRKQFHLPCGRRKSAVSLFYGNYKSFCELHAPKQKISESVMANAKERVKRDKLVRTGKIPVSNIEEGKQTEKHEDPALLCVICYEDVQAYPTTQTFWPPCCGRDAWLHRNCLQRMALSAGMHYLKCPLCNDKDTFYDAVCEQGYYLPDRDAAWELEQNAFAEIYNRDSECAALECKCPFGRGHDELGMWDIQLCLLCGSWGMHASCSGGERAVCASCRPAAAGIEQLEARLTAVIMAEQAREQHRARSRSGRVMPPRMSLRRTKGRLQLDSSSSSSQNLTALETTEIKTEPPSPTKDRLELNLKAPRRVLLTPSLRARELESRLLSPLKMLEQSYRQRGGGGDVVVTSEVIEKIRLRFSKPKPLSAKKKIVNEILEDLFKNVFKENSKSKEPVKEWNSPRRSSDVTDANQEANVSLEPILNTNTVETESSEKVANPEENVEKVDVNSEGDSNKYDDESSKENDGNDSEQKSNKFDDESSKQNDGNVSEQKSNKFADESSKENDENVSEQKSNKFDDESSKQNDGNVSEQKSNKFADESSKENDENVSEQKSNKFDDESSKQNDGNVSEQKSNKFDDESSKQNDGNVSEQKSNKLDYEPSKIEPNDLSNDENCVRDAVIDGDESSRSTFQLPSEFVAESEDSLPILDTPKKLKMVDMTQDCTEISENNEALNIDVVKTGSDNEKEFIKNLIIQTPPVPVKNRLYSFKFSPLEKEPLQTENVDMDVESFKDQYLSEVDRDQSSAHLKDDVLRSVDVNVERKAGKKRKLDMQGGVGVVKQRKGEKRKKLKIKISNKKARERVKKMKRIKGGNVKIKLKEKKKKVMSYKTYKQYVLKYSPLKTNKVLAKPEVDVTPMKRKYVKLEKSPDNLVQTSIQSFFKAK